MALLPILKYPHPNLHKVAERVTKFDDELSQFAHDMLETMYEARGVGLAATQVDTHRRVVVMDVSEEGNEPRILINPEITHFSDELVDSEEGCLSIPGINEKVKRSATVKAQAQNLKGETFFIDADGLLAICLQHEVDHLNGILFIEKLSPLKLNRIKTKLKKARKAEEAA